MRYLPNGCLTGHAIEKSLFVPFIQLQALQTLLLAGSTKVIEFGDRRNKSKEDLTKVHNQSERWAPEDSINGEFVRTGNGWKRDTLQSYVTREVEIKRGR